MPSLKCACIYEIAALIREAVCGAGALAALFLKILSKPDTRLIIFVIALADIISEEIRI